MVLGHQKQRALLRKISELGKLPHAVLFSGQEKIGKKTLALDFIKYLYCENQKACGQCRSCKEVEKRKHPDLALIENKGSIQISQIRDLISRLSLKPYSAPLKVGIIDMAHNMTLPAQSCFLKLLEEPKGDTLLIMITEYPETLLSTITSRLQTLRFSPVEKKIIKEYLLKKGISKEKAEELSSISLGKPGRVIDFIDYPEKLKERKDIILDLLKLKDSSFSERFKYAKEISGSSEKTMEILSVWSEYLREILISKSGFKGYSPLKIKNFIKKLQTTQFLIYTTNVSLKFAVENLLITL